MSLLDWFRKDPPAAWTPPREEPKVELPAMKHPVKPQPVVIVTDPPEVPEIKAEVPEVKEPAPKVVDISKQTRLAQPKTETGLRQGMWVVWHGPRGKKLPEDDEFRVGILTTWDINGARVDSVRPDGTTLLSGIRMDLSDLRQATYEQIPVPRRPRGTDKDYAARRAILTRLGYV